MNANDQSSGPSIGQTTTASPSKSFVRDRDFDDLYQLSKGMPYANAILDAKAQFVDQDFEAATATVTLAIEMHQARMVKKQRRKKESSSGEKKISDRRAKAAKEKEEKYRKIEVSLERLKKALTRRKESMDSRQSESAETSEPNHAGESKTATSNEDVSHLIPNWLVEGFCAAGSNNHQLELIGDYFRGAPVRSKRDISTDCLYLMKTKFNNHLLRILSVHPVSETVEFDLISSTQSARPQPMEKLVSEGKKKRLIRLEPKLQQSNEEADSKDQDAGEKSDTAEQPTNKPSVGFDSILEMGAFSQLFDAAQRSGLVPGADLIAHVRDREFRLGDYPKAFQLIEGLYGKFCAASTARDQRLRREDVDIASGKIKISPKELQAKRVRDTADSQRIDRARNRFCRVLEGLRVIVAKQIEERDRLENEAANQNPDSEDHS